jgi:hypothetical protein
VNAVVFAGPTIPAGDVAAIVEAVCLPPAAQGDVYRVSLERPRVIGLIDGYFERQPAVWHKEILWALSEGIHVFGSASMGALRAAELAPFGMVGVGAIFEAYRDGVLEDDDEVAVIHGPEDTGYRAGSDAMVNIRATLARARHLGVLDDTVCATLERIAKGLFYAERTYAQVLEAGREAGLPVSDLDAFQRWLPEGSVNQKHDDAVAMLNAMRECLDSVPGPRHVDFVFQDSLWWHALRATASESGTRREDERVIAALGLDPVARDQAVAGALGWWLAEQRAGRHGETTEAAGLVEQAEDLCSRHELSDAAAVERWLGENRFTRPELERLLETRAHAARAVGRAGDVLLPTLLQYLRWTGDYARLLSHDPTSGPDREGGADRECGERTDPLT